MDKKEEFDLEFDFEKEFGFDPKELLGDESEDADDQLDLFSGDFGDLTESEPASDDELDDLLSDDFLASLGIDIDKDEDEDDAAEAFDAPAEDAPEDDTMLSSFLQEEDVLPEEEIPQEDEVPHEDDVLKDDDLLQVDFTGIDEDVSFDAEPVISDTDEDPVNIFVPAAEPAFEVEPELGEDFMAAFEKDFPADEPEEKPLPKERPARRDRTASTGEVKSVQDPAAPANPRRRKKMSRERIIKEVYLPPIIAALTLILVITFIVSSVSRTLSGIKDREEALAASNEAASSAQQSQVDMLIEEAKALAAVYDYDAAIAKLDSFDGEMSKYPTMMDLYNTYTQARSKLVAFEDYASIPNLSFHGLIADPSRAFIDETFGKSYNANYVTTDEFSKILQQLYNNDYVLVDFDSFVIETSAEDGTVTYSTQPLYLPEGKKPLMLTQTLVNYEIFTIDSDGDGEADKGGDGFASRLIVDANGDIVNEMVDSNGNTVTGAYDLVPILNAFLKEHPDFSYRGARAILAVTGEDGVFGYRIMHSVKESKGEDYYNQQVEGAKKIAKALRDEGYTIACYTYSNISYGELSATKIQADLDMWSKEVVPVLGKVNLLVYAKGSDITANEGYANNNKYNVLYQEGFRYFVSSANVPWAEVTNEYVRQSRIMVTGGLMQSTPSTYTKFFDPASVLNELRGS